MTNLYTKAANGEWYRYVSGSADQDMSEDKGMNMTEGSTRMLTISASSAREHNNNNHEPELRRKNEMEQDRLQMIIWYYPVLISLDLSKRS